jgi:hypothetical protein
MSIILNEVINTIRKIKYEGILINDTVEKQNVISIFYPNNFNIEEEEKEISYFYNKFVGNWDKRIELEKDHYNFLKSFIIHKVKENQYFFKLKSDDFTSRKNIIWSNDCIGCIQLLCRPDQNFFNVFIRSSDTVNLLLADYVYMTKVFDEVLERFNIKKKLTDKITFFISSCHFYAEDYGIVEEILTNA